MNCPDPLRILISMRSSGHLPGTAVARNLSRTPLYRRVRVWALIAIWSNAQACLGFDLRQDPLFQLDPVAVSPASPMLDAVSTSRACADGVRSKYALLDVVENALCHNPKTRAAWANVKAQAAQVGVAKAAYLPTLSGSIQTVKDHASSHGTGANPFSAASSSTYHNDTLTLSWVLYDFGLRSATVDNAEKMLASAMASQNNVLQTVFANTVKDYYAALVAQKNIEATREIEVAARDVLDAAAVRVRGGVAAISDQLQAQTAYSQAIYNRNKAEGDWLSALGTLAIDMGKHPNSQIRLIELDNPILPESAFARSVDELLQTAQQAHPSLIAARAELEAAQANEHIVQAQGRPSVSLATRYNVNNQPQSLGLGQQTIGAVARDRFIGVQVDIPIFEGFARTYKIRNAQAQVEGKAASLSDAELQVAVSVWTNYQGLKVSAENVRTSQEIMDSAQLAFKAAESRYQKGVANILELITTQTALANAQQQRIQALAGWQNARVQLAASLGTLDLSAIR